MRTILLKSVGLLWIGAAAILSAADMVPGEELARAQAAYASKDYAAATTHLVWFWEHADPTLAGVKGSSGGDLFHQLAEVHPPAKEAFLREMNGALQRALADTRSPADLANAGGMPPNHLALLDYLNLAKRVQQPSEIAASFKQVAAVNPTLAEWEYHAFAPQLLEAGEFVLMNGYTAPWAKEERRISERMLQGYAFVRSGLYSQCLAIDMIISDLKIMRPCIVRITAMMSCCSSKRS